MRKKFSGFTLIELLVVISIIGILIALSAVAFQSSRASARDAKRKADLETIRSALEMYKTDCGSYPLSAYLDYFTRLSGGAFVGPSGLRCEGNTYLSSTPRDPLPEQFMYRYFRSGGSGTPFSYVLCAHLENGGTTIPAGCSSACVAAGTGGAGCNYSVSSP